MRIIFIGTPSFASIILEKLVENIYKPSLVITVPDKPIGRKKTITGPPLKITSQKYNIEVCQTNRIKDLKSKIQGLYPDLIITAAYGQIIPKDILIIPVFGSLNVHPSLLPKHRGPSPIQTAILNGDEKTGTTIYLMNEKIDQGPIISQQELNLPTDKITYERLNKILAELSAELLINIIPKWINDEIKAKAQDESKATYTNIIKKEDGKIDWNKPAFEIEREIRAFYPWPGSFTFMKKDNKILRVKILEADVSQIEEPNKLSIKCKQDYLIIKKLQPEAKNPITGQEFLKGYKGFTVLK